MTDIVAYILASGPSMTFEDATKATALGDVITVNNTILMAPTSHFLIAQDYHWWEEYGDAVIDSGFNGTVYTYSKLAQIPFHTEYIPDKVARRLTHGAISVIPNSGALAIYTAATLGYKEIRLLGFDMHGSHYFGRYDEVNLLNTEDNPERYGAMFTEYENLAEMIKEDYNDVHVVNCTKGSSLKMFEMGEI